MSDLTKQKYWDTVHIKEQREFDDAVLIEQATNLALGKKITGALKKLLGAAILERISNYDDYLLWSAILPRILPSLNGFHALEIGSAPGDHIVKFSKRYGCIPYGVEYSQFGVDVNRDVFRKNGFDSDNVIHADFFSEEFIAAHRERFDVVISRGFIEHFEDAKSVIDRHTQLLKPGGYLIVSIPNLHGVNYVFSKLFDESSIPRHNLTIMRRSAFAELFDPNGLERMFCDYYGTFSFYLFTAGPSSLQRNLLRFCFRLQPLLNFVMRTAWGSKGAETALFSPFLLYVGRKSIGCATPLLK